MPEAARDEFGPAVASTTTCTTLRERDHDPARYDDSQTQVRGSPAGTPLLSASQTAASMAGSARRFSTALLRTRAIS